MKYNKDWAHLILKAMEDHPEPIVSRLYYGLALREKPMGKFERFFQWSHMILETPGLDIGRPHWKH